LKSSDSKGSCFVETKGLDGETNLKIKKVQKVINEKFLEESHVHELNGHIHCENPNSAIYKFEGYMQLGMEGEKISLNSDYLLLRGMSIKNTEFVLGIVVFTGHDTKVMQNSASAKYKFSRLELLSNQSIFIIFTI
jgi:phospholipid-transporting ATPase